MTMAVHTTVSTAWPCWSNMPRSPLERLICLSTLGESIDPHLSCPSVMASHVLETPLGGERYRVRWPYSICRACLHACTQVLSNVLVVLVMGR